MTPPGRVVRGIRRAFRANSARELTTRELWSWTHPREVHCRDRFRRKNISRAIRGAADQMAIRVRWDGVENARSEHLAMGAKRAVNRAAAKAGGSPMSAMRRREFIAFGKWRVRNLLANGAHHA
jgi:hypothetical protein